MEEQPIDDAYFCYSEFRAIRSNRKHLPKDLKHDKDLKRGDIDSRV